MDLQNIKKIQNDQFRAIFMWGFKCSCTDLYFDIPLAIGELVLWLISPERL